MPWDYQHRSKVLEELAASDKEWDLLIIGGGATGLGAAVEGALRGYRTLLVEQHDFAKGTSSRSTKLVHGGVRYLAQGDIPLVLEALRERGRLRKNAPHLVKNQAFVIPCYSWWCIPFYTIGLTLYDLLAGKLGLGRSRPLSRKRTGEALPCIRKAGLKGGVRYFDCQFDDARMAINLAQTAVEQGAEVLNYCEVSGLLKENGRVSGVLVKDRMGGQEFRVRARSVINATGVFVDRILKLDQPGAPDTVKPSQGIHLVLDQRFMDGGEALMIPRTSDGRVLFAVPWHGKLVVGTTDVEKHEALLEPLPEREEVEYILETAGRYLDGPPAKEDVLSVFTGLRPLAAPTGEGKKTKEISRGHKIMTSPSGLITITGGKWTTYRKMAEDVVNRAFPGSNNQPENRQSSKLKIHGSSKVIHSEPLSWYGSDKQEVEGGILLSECLQINSSQVVWAVRAEMALQVEDVLGRRTRAIQLDARESIRIAPEVARIMASEMGKTEQWVEEQIASFTRLAKMNLLTDT